MPSTYDPEIYDLTTPAAIQGDVEWYRERAREAGGPVLELGAGTGRITIPLAHRAWRSTLGTLSPGRPHPLAPSP